MANEINISNPETREEESGMLSAPLRPINDPEGLSVPRGLPPVVDAHIHLFPEDVFSSIFQWFDRFGWPIRYRLKSEEIVEYLLSRGIRHLVALSYAHRPGLAWELNAYMAEICSRFPQVTGMATVLPGEPEARKVLEEAFRLGLKGVKLHSHVQCFDMSSGEMEEIYEICEAEDRPLLMHVGREPKSPAYRCDPYELCSAEKLEKVINGHPRLRICVPHMGADEFAAYKRMLEEYDTLWLDTTMAFADFLPNLVPPSLGEMRLDRVMYGTDFPSIAYAWDRELKRIAELGLPEEALRLILAENAMEFYGFEI